MITDPGYPDPFASAAAAASQPPSIVRLAPDVQIPQTRAVQRRARSSAAESADAVGDLHRRARLSHVPSRDVNAPPPPLYLTRPDPAYGAVRQVESTGRQATDSLQVTLRGKVTRWFNGQMQYTLSRADNDTNGIGSFPANDYDLSGEWARADFDRRHRFVTARPVTGVKVVDLGVGLTMNSAGLTPRRSAATLTTTAAAARGRPASRATVSNAGDLASLDLRRRATSSSARARTRPRADARVRRVQRAEPRQLRVFRRHPRLAAVRPAGLGAGGAAAAVFSPLQVLAVRTRDIVDFTPVTDRTVSRGLSLAPTTADATKRRRG